MLQRNCVYPQTWSFSAMRFQSLLWFSFDSRSNILSSDLVQLFWFTRGCPKWHHCSWHSKAVRLGSWKDQNAKQWYKTQGGGAGISHYWLSRFVSNFNKNNCHFWRQIAWHFELLLSSWWGHTQLHLLFQNRRKFCNYRRAQYGGRGRGGGGPTRWKIFLAQRNHTGKSCQLFFNLVYSRTFQTNFQQTC